MGKGVPPAPPALLAAIAAAVLSMPASASAATRVVDLQAGPYTTITDALLAASPGDTIDIHQGHYAEDLWVDKDDITLRGAPGTIVSETGPYVVALMGARATVENLTIAGGPGGVRIAGTGAQLRDVTVLADATALSAEGGISTTLTRTTLRATGLSGTALLARNDTPEPQSTTLHSSVLAGGRLGTGADLTAGATGDTAPVGGIQLTLWFVSIGGAPTAVRATRLGQGGAIRVPSASSVIRGDTSTVAEGAFKDPWPADPFVDATAPDLHLRADYPYMRWGNGTGPEGNERDVEGRERLADGTSDYGAYEFVDHPPTARLTASAATVAQGAPVTFDARGSSDPDPGGAIRRLTWLVDDVAPDLASLTTRTTSFTALGTHRVTVRVYDQQDAIDVASATVAVVDVTAPVLAVTAPRERGKHPQLRRSGRKRVVNVVKLAGRATDGIGGGVARVDVTLQRGKVRHAGRATLGRGGALSWHSPAKAKLARGRWTLTARATDRAGNASQTVLHFTVT